MLLGVSAIGEKLLALSICEEFHFMRPPGSGWLAGNAGLGSVTSAGAAGVDAAIREAEMESGTADALPRAGRKSVPITRDPTLEAVGRRLRVDKGADRAGPGRMTRDKLNRRSARRTERP